MHDIDVSVKGSAAARVRQGSTVGEVLGRLAVDLAGQALAARVDGREVDLAFRLEPTRGDSPVEIEPILASTRDGLEVLRHSTAHLLAAAVLDLFPGTKLGIGPALLDDPRFGFFYDVIAPRPLTEGDLPAIEGRMRELVQRGLAYRSEEAPKAAVLRLFAERGEPLKCELIEDKGSERVSLYRIDGTPFVDFCLGPHVPSTNRLHAFRILSRAPTGKATRSGRRCSASTAPPSRLSPSWRRGSASERRRSGAITAASDGSWICSRSGRSTARGSSSGIPREAWCAR